MNDLRARLSAARAAEREKYEKHYIEVLARAKTALAEREGVFAISHASYLLRLGGKLIAVDPNEWLTPKADGCLEALFSLLSECDAVIVTHDHTDHYTPSLLRALPEGVVRFIPSFVPYDGANERKADDGAVFSLADVTISFFETVHYADRSLKECGFSLTYGGKNYVFPTDVRLYDAPHAVFPNTVLLMAHLWLGRGCACDAQTCDTEAFCRFVSSHHPETVLVSHLNDYKRDLEFFWSEAHYEMVKDSLPFESRSFGFGDVFYFG